MCSLIQKYRCQVREYLQSMYLGTGSPSGPQVTASIPGWSSLRLWDKDGLALSLPTLCSPETPRSGDSHRQPTPKGASRLTWETSPSNSLKQAGFKQKAALFFPPATALRSAWLTYLNDAISFPSLPVLRTSLIWSSRLTLKPGPVKIEISVPCHSRLSLLSLNHWPPRPAASLALTRGLESGIYFHCPFTPPPPPPSPLLGWGQGKGAGAKWTKVLPDRCFCDAVLMPPGSPHPRLGRKSQSHISHFIDDPFEILFSS